MSSCIKTSIQLTFVLSHNTCKNVESTEKFWHMLVTEIEISLKDRQLVLASLLLSGHVFLYQNIDTIDICIVSQYIQKC